METGWTAVPCPTTNLNILICKSSARTRTKRDSCCSQNICRNKIGNLYTIGVAMGVKGAMPPKCLERMVILSFERHFSKQNSVIRLKSNILSPPFFAPPKSWTGYATAVYAKRHFCIDPMTILVSHQAVPPTFITKLRPWLWRHKHWNMTSLPIHHMKV